MDKTKLNHSIKLLIVSIIAFLCIPLGQLSHLGDFYYKTIYYGTLVKMFNYIVQAIIWMVAIILINTITKRKLKFSPLIDKKPKEYLPIKNMIVLTILTVLPILIVSGLVGWNFKPIYDLGAHFTGLQLGTHLINLLSQVFKLVLVYIIIRTSHEALSNLFPKYKTIPFGAIFALLTFGLYELLLKVHYLPVIYLLLIFVMFYQYLFSNKTFSKSFILMALIYLV